MALKIIESEDWGETTLDLRSPFATLGPLRLSHRGQTPAQARVHDPATRGVRVDGCSALKCNQASRAGTRPREITLIHKKFRNKSESLFSHMSADRVSFVCRAGLWRTELTAGGVGTAFVKDGSQA